MPDRKTKREIREIVKKYTGQSSRADLAKIGLISGSFTATGVAMDLMFTGGLFSIGTAMFGGVGGATGLLGSGAVISDNIKKNHANTAGQTLRCTTLVNNTLEAMQLRLQDAFFRASTPRTKEKFLRLAAEVEADAAKLAPAFNLVAGGPNGYGTDKYEFIVDANEDITLTEALQKLNPQKTPNPLTPEEEIRLFKERLHRLENPRVTKLDKPSHPPSP